MTTIETDAAGRLDPDPAGNLVVVRDLLGNPLLSPDEAVDAILLADISSES
jgi:hypothetical protein